MPFIVQCPYPQCQKYMLFEDEHRGSMRNCLVCKQPIQLDGDAQDEQQTSDQPAETAQKKPAPQRQAPPQQQPAHEKPAHEKSAHEKSAPQPTPELEIRGCPACNAKVRVPKSVGRVKCPRCNHVF